MNSKLKQKVIALEARRDTKSLIKLLKTGDFESRWLAAECLGNLKAGEAKPDLIAALNDPVKLVVLAVIQALEQIGMDGKTKSLAEARIAELNRLEQNHQINLQEAVAKRGDPDIAEAKRMQEILSLSGAHKQMTEENEKTNTVLLIAVTILGLLGIVAWFIRLLW
ncbi:MAG: HEAT repeat domain-containing protein [Cyclobacteriaceae bacterium]|nr:HEAT repeat domain-containing protein [Cyclobacteriaceae bacterium]